MFIFQRTPINFALKLPVFYFHSLFSKLNFGRQFKNMQIIKENKLLAPPLDDVIVSNNIAHLVDKMSGISSKLNEHKILNF